MAEPLFQRPDPHPRPPSGYRMPAGSCDTHAHVVGPNSKYPLSGGRQGVVPPEALLHEYKHMLSSLGIARCVLVTPTVYGTDNSSTLDAIASAPDHMRGIALVDTSTSDAEFKRLHAGGMRGVRFNTRGSMATSAGTAPAVSLDAALGFGDTLKRMGWHAQFLLLADQYPDADHVFKDYPVDVVIDHLGYLDPARGIDSPGFKCLLRWVETGCCWVKLSAPYRHSKQNPPYADIAPYAKKLIAAAPERMVWASDWPHSAVFTPDTVGKKRLPNCGELADLLADWAPDEKVRHKILVENPAKLYGFA